MQQVDVLGREALHVAAQAGNTEVMQFLIDYCRVDVNKAAGAGCITPLHCAAKVGAPAIILSIPSW